MTGTCHECGHYSDDLLYGGEPPSWTCPDCRGADPSVGRP